ncbi:MAG: histidine--tRNA ligase [Muribaculaceae bacterium]|nr:histidine--tRNA ligase [Muribaculaceae bacterium]
MAQKPSIPKGTRDFGAAEMARRNYIFDTIRSVFRLYGFRPIETPAMENLSTLMGKYGEEGDKLLFKILNSGDWTRGVDPAMVEAGEAAKLTSKVSEKGLRYDLTVPFARFVVQHRAELQMPFKRYQIQPVWRADRPQKGRYREFYQCDADVVGSDSLLNEIELLSLVDEVFARLGIRITIKLNNRKVLAGIAEHIGEPDKLIDITTAIDKIDKIGMDAVCAELAERGLRPESIEALRPILAIGGSIDERLDALDTLLAGNATGVLGVAELREVVAGLAATGLRAELDLDVSLARGLNYYTGTIIEVKARDVAIGSITGGGRYDNLTGVFGMPGLSGVGISFGADRIYDVLNALDLYPAEAQNSTRVIFLNLGKAEAAASLRAAMELRAAGVAAEVYPDAAKMKKQMGYADALGIPFVAIIGEEELAEGSVTLKNMTTGEQKRVSAAQLKDALA